MPSTPHPRIEAHNLDPERLPSYAPDGSTEARLVEPVLDAIREAVADCSVIAASTVAGRIYTRKSEEVVDLFGHNRNPHYGSDHDDYYLSLSVRVTSHAAKPVLDALRRIENMADEQRLREAQARLQAAKAAVQAAVDAEARIQAEIDQLQG